MSRTIEKETEKMLRSLYTGVSGLKNFQTEMDVISNNIANVSTTAYKRSRVSFETMFSETIRHGQQAFGDYGGLNPMQVGLGTAMASIDTLMDQGPTETTGKNTDIAIEGDGFLVVRGYDGTNYYTRDGNLNIGTNYDLVMTNTGFKAQGWLAKQDPVTGNLSISDSGIVPENLNLATFLKKHAKQTNNITYSCNLDAGSEERDVALGEDTLNFHDSTGKSQELSFKFKKIDANHWIWSAYDDTEGHVATGSLTCDDDGLIINSTVDPQGALSTAGNPYFTYDPDGDPQPAMVTSPTPNASNTNYNSGLAGDFSSIQLTDDQIVTEDIQVIFDGGDPDHA
ncbi:MAG: flagellar hook-basal body complex protein, partial [Candidatus Riflebacteria bacterium]